MIFFNIAELATSGDTGICLLVNPFAELTACRIIELGNLQMFKACNVVVNTPGQDMMVNLEDTNPVLSG